MANTNTLKQTLLNGFIKENPTFRLVLGMCPTLAVSTSVVNGLSMGVATMAVLVCSNVLISLLRGFITPRIRIPAFIVIAASTVTVIELFLKAYLPELSRSLGLYIPLIVVNCIIFARGESFAYKNPVFISAVDGLSMGLGFTLSLTILSAVREIIGSGTILGLAIPFLSEAPALMIILPPGGFLMLGLLLVAFNAFAKKFDARKEAA